MTSASALIFCAVLAWLAQIALGWWQLQRFNRAFDRLCQQGTVGVGRSAGRFKPRVVLALAFDKDENVCGGFLLRGLTIFASPQPLFMLNGMSRQQLMTGVIFPKDPNVQTALSLAIKPKS
ncbi:transcriptional regulator GutM [Ewingella americana]|jgi:glucitol operon activator protein|uniref:Transcriptional regulator GutM n=1 Tax=Ewingella americana TaxID=41202 RepID=A0A502GK08_9GAMM|nr:transcriptional regulator GutM [Ewingella americana]TPG62131.1 transcriptional regulator GutM [Ewingella americana]